MRESTPSIEAEINETEKLLLSGGVTKVQARAIPLFALYCHAEAQIATRNPTRSDLLRHIKNVISEVLDEIGQAHRAEYVQQMTQLDDLSLILIEVFDMHQPSDMMANFHRLCQGLGKPS